MSINNQTINDDLILTHTRPLCKLFGNMKFMGSNLSDNILRLIESSTHTLNGAAFVVQKSIKLYDDSILRNQLASIPIAQRENMSLTLFIKIARMSSGMRISFLEAEHMYVKFRRRLNTMLEKRRAQSFDAAEFFDYEAEWKILSNMLLKKLFILYLAKEYFVNKPFLLLQTSSMHSPSGKARKHKGKNHFVGSMASLSSSATSYKTNSKKLNSLSKSKSNNDSNVNDLNFLLSKSQKVQKRLTDQIISNLAKTAQAVTFSGFESAVSFAKHVGSRKIEILLNKKTITSYRLVIKKWMEVMDVFHSEKICMILLHHIATYRLGHLIHCNILGKKQRYLRYLKEQCNRYQTNERLAAVVEIQRIVRGRYGRQYAYRTKRYQAARNIQKLYRGILGRKIYQDLIYKRMVKNAVILIERTWFAHRFKRSVLKLIKSLKYNRRATIIQRNWRGKKGREKAKKRKNYLQRQKGALKMQCLWRRYQAILLVEKYMHNANVLKKIILIQCTVRVMLAKLQYKDLKEKIIRACVLQRAWRCYLARQVLRYKYESYAALIIQKRFRMHRASIRVQTIRQSRAADEMKRNQCGCLILLVMRGNKDRMKFLRMRYAHRVRRYNAAVKIQKKIKNFLEISKAKKILRNLRRLKREKLRTEAIRNRSARVLQRSIMAYLYRLEVERLRQIERNEAAICIQTRIRGMLGRAEAYRRQIELAEESKAERPLPIYYKLKNLYYRDQNLYHRTNVIIIQCIWRQSLAKMKVRRIKVHNATRIISKWLLRMHETSRERYMLRYMKLRRKVQNRAANKIIKQAKIFIAGGTERRNNYMNKIKWFLYFAKIRRLTSSAIMSFK